MKTPIKMIFLSLASALSFPAWSSTAYEGELRDMHFMNSGAVLISTTGNRTTAPGCSTYPGRFAVDSTTPSGRSITAGLLAAETAGRNVVIVGTGLCDVYGDSETIAYFYIVG
ncbi:hypothetical protein [Steroidobacter cummioxidans]|uniref:hypothetical protein n=1 Tax=Steroidobacter cummioxidans TaxID=1803913 RepID=UPI000E30F865|nr:hypothetical protein [Steroidobacter cummioxidans]